MSNTPDLIKRLQAKNASATVRFGGVGGEERASAVSGFRLRRFKSRTLVEFTRSLAVLVGARVSLMRALESAGSQCQDRHFEPVIARLRDRAARGSSLSGAMAEEPAVFDTLYVQMVKVGETGGMLDEVLQRMAVFLEKKAELKRKVALAFAYPVLILSVATVVVVFLLTVIVPLFAEMFDNFGAELPGPTRIVLSLSNSISSNLWWIIPGFAAAIIAGKVVIQGKTGRSFLDAMLLRLPLTGPLMTKNLTARFCRTLGTLLHAGISLLPALRTVAKTSGNAHFEREIHSIIDAVSRGRGIVESLQTKSIFPSMVRTMIGVGEETAQLDEMLLHIAGHYEDEVDQTVDTLTTLLEPALIVILGVIIGGILVAMYLPMFDLVGVAGG